MRLVKGFLRFWQGDFTPTKSSDVELELEALVRAHEEQFPGNSGITTIGRVYTLGGRRLPRVCVANENEVSEFGFEPNGYPYLVVTDQTTTLYKRAL